MILRAKPLKRLGFSVRASATSLKRGVNESKRCFVGARAALRKERTMRFSGHVPLFFRALALLTPAAALAWGPGLKAGNFRWKAFDIWRLSEILALRMDLFFGWERPALGKDAS